MFPSAATRLHCGQTFLEHFFIRKLHIYPTKLSIHRAESLTIKRNMLYVVYSLILSKDNFIPLIKKV